MAIGIRGGYDCVNSGTVTAENCIAAGAYYASDSVNTGKITGGMQAYGLNDCENCENTGTIVSDTAYGVAYSSDSHNSGDFQVLGKMPDVWIWPINDSGWDSDSNNNTNTGTVLYENKYGSTLDSWNYEFILNSYSRDMSDFDIDACVNAVDAKEIRIAIEPGQYILDDSGHVIGAAPAFNQDISIVKKNSNLEFCYIGLEATTNYGDISVMIEGGSDAVVRVYGGRYNLRIFIAKEKHCGNLKISRFSGRMAHCQNFNFANAICFADLQTFRFATSS